MSKSRNIFNNNKEEIINKYKEGYTAKELGIIFKIDRKSLKMFLEENNVKIRTKGEITCRQKQKIKKSFIEKYGVENISQLSYIKEIVSKKASKRKKGVWAGEKNPNYGNKIGKNNGYHFGKRDDLGDIFWRSSWEANIARFFNFKNIEWEYEPKRFKLSNGETYTPDFLIKKLNCFIEVKGWWREDAKIKFNLFKEEYKNIKIKLIESNIYYWIIKRYSENISFEGKK